MRVVQKRTVVGESLTFRQPEGKSSSLDSEDDFHSGCRNVSDSPITVLFRTTLIQTITTYDLLILPGSNLFLY